MEKFYYAYETLKYNIKQYGLIKCEADIDNMLQIYADHHNIGPCIIKKSPIGKKFKK